MDAAFLSPLRNLKWSAVLSKIMPLELKWPNQTIRFVQRPNTFQFVSFTFMTTSKRGSSQLSMSRQNISSPIFLRSLCPVINTSAYVIKSWGGRLLHLLNTRECEVVVGSSPGCLPTSVPVLPSNIVPPTIHAIVSIYLLLNATFSYS